MLDWIEVRVQKKVVEATDVCSFELVDCAGYPLPSFTAGAHVDAQIRTDLVRQYSLCNKPSERHHYVIAVLRERTSRGGSVTMHDQIAEGGHFRISRPRNLFPLDVSVSNVLLIAGGIGITPILCMAEQLAESGTKFSLHYCARSMERMAFRQRIAQSCFAGNSTFYFDEGPRACRLDISEVLSACDSDTHLYVCGPTGLIENVLCNANRLGWPKSRLHREYFVAPERTSDRVCSFEIQLASTGSVYSIPPDKSVVDVLAANGIDVPVSCEQGICGTCLTRVLSGEPEHLDTFLTPQEHARNDQFTPCCSRSRSDRLVIDL